MQRVQLDFLHPAGKHIPLGLLLLGFGLLSASLTFWKFQQLATEQALLQAQIGDTERLIRREMPTVHSDDKQLADQVVRANVVLSALTMPWDAMFGELEGVADENVALLAIQPDAAGKHVRLSGEARRYENILAYMKRLEQTVGFANVYLLGHEARDEGGVSFSVVADWVGHQ